MIESWTHIEKYNNKYNKLRQKNGQLTMNNRITNKRCMQINVQDKADIKHKYKWHNGKNGNTNDGEGNR